MRNMATALVLSAFLSACGKEKCGSDETTVVGQFNMAGTYFSIDESTASGLNFGTAHKIDVDRYESGCVSRVGLRIRPGGVGCEMNLELRPNSDGNYTLTSFTFSADSYCPNFRDELEGEYSTDGSDSSINYSMPHQVDMETGTEDRVCLDNINYWLSAEGTLRSDSGRERSFELNIELSGDHVSNGDTSADCDVRWGGGGWDDDDDDW